MIKKMVRNKKGIKKKLKYIFILLEKILMRLLKKKFSFYSKSWK